MGFLSKRKAKKEAKKAQAATDGAAAAQAVSTKEPAAAAKVPGEIKIQHHDGPQSGTKTKSGGAAAPLSSSGKAISLRKRLRENVSTKRPMIRCRPPRSPGGQSHVSAITRDTAFPETPKRRLFLPPPTSNLLPDDDYDCIDENDAVVGGVIIAGGWAGGA